MSDAQWYELKGVIENIGKSTTEGHYIAYTRDEAIWTEWKDEFSRQSLGKRSGTNKPASYFGKG